MFRQTINKNKPFQAGVVVAEMRRRGMRLTPQRRAILRILESNASHPTAEDIHREVKRRFPETTSATVYNTVLALSKLDALSPITFGEGVRRYDPNTAPHHHFICKACGKIEDIIESIDGVQPGRILAKRGYRVSELRVTVYGFCPKCHIQDRSGNKH